MTDDLLDNPRDAGAAVGAKASHETLLGDTNPVGTPLHDVLDLTSRDMGDNDDGSTLRLAWSARSDVGLVREHNEDSFLVRAPLFAVCDGMGGHAAGEVASTIAVHVIAEQTPAHATDVELGAAIEAANTKVIEGAATGVGEPGMGCTATAAFIEGDKMAVAHVGDSRIYLLNAGNLVRVTHDHSFVEELVDAGEITADEARVHPSRSVITRALGNDPTMYADHFTLGVEKGDRIIICSDGLSSMIDDSDIEALACTSPTPKECTDNLIGAALAAGGSDNVSVVTIDVVDDGVAEQHRRESLKKLRNLLIAIVAVVVAFAIGAAFFINQSWYVGNNLGTVGIYHGIKGSLFSLKLSSLTESTSINVSDLPDSTQKMLSEGIRVSSEEEARTTVESYRSQIDAEKTKAAETAETAQAATAAQSAASEQATSQAATSAAASTEAASTDAAATTGGE